MPEQTQPELALEKGREILRRRRRFGREVEAGEAKLSEVLVDGILMGLPVPDWLKNAKLGLILRWLPGVGPATVEKILARIPLNYDPNAAFKECSSLVSSTQLLSELSYRQRVALSLLIERYER